MNKLFKTLSVFILIGLFFSTNSLIGVFAKNKAIKDNIIIKKDAEAHASTETTGVVGGNNPLQFEETDVTDKVLTDLEKKYDDNSTTETNTTTIPEQK